MTLLDRLRQGLRRTTAQLSERFDQILGGGGGGEPAPAVATDTVDALEEVLLEADVGVSATDRIITAVRDGATSSGGDELRALVKQEILAILDVPTAPANNGGSPHVVLVVGVNGTGKTTTVGKLAQLWRKNGKQPLICAADTFRAAAVEQLEIWAERVGVDIVKARPGGDPAAIVFDALQAGRARGKDVVLVDTAGRLHTRDDLMSELQKIRRVASRAVEGAPHEVLLVLDATVGQNGLAQAKQFYDRAQITGVVLTKIDGTAKGGVAVAVASDLGVPIRYVGVGETADDLLPFSAHDYVEALFTRSW